MLFLSEKKLVVAAACRILECDLKLFIHGKFILARSKWLKNRWEVSFGNQSMNINTKYAWNDRRS